MRRRLIIVLAVAMVLVGLLVIALLSFFVYLRVSAHRAEGDLKRAIAKIAASGAPVSAAQLIKPPIPDAQNAAVVYRQAFTAMLLTDDDKQFISDVLSGKRPLAEAKTAARVTAILDRNTAAMALLYRATKMPRCDFRYDWKKGVDLSFPEFSRLRASCRLLCLQAAVRSRDGDADDALAACGASFRMARAADIPSVIGQLVQAAMISIASRSANSVLRDSQSSPAASAAVVRDIERFDLTTSLAAALEGERAMGIMLFERIRASDDPWRVMRELTEGLGEAHVPPTRRLPLSRPRIWWLSHDELTYIRVMKPVLDHSRSSYREIAHINPPIDAGADVLGPWPPHLITMILVPAYTRVFQARDRAIANLALDQTALRLKIHRAEHGAYPRTLEELARASGDGAPEDPFSGKPLAYRREGSGFLLYSWGPNLKDDGGAPPPKDQPDEGDMVFRCVR